MAAPDSKNRLKSWWKRNELNVSLVILGLLFLVIFFSSRIFITIDSGHRGVLWTRFGGGTVTSQSYGEGIHVIFPWNRMYIYETRLATTNFTIDVLSSDGLRMAVEFGIRFKPVNDNLGLLHKQVGPNYVQILVLPEIGAHARELIGRYEPEQLYSSERIGIQRRILARTREGIRVRTTPRPNGESMVYVEDVLIRSITLPPEVQKAINDKLAQEQRMLEYDYRLGKEVKEAQRKRIEAEGIRAFQDIVAEGISDRYLRWKGIDATLELARSNNSKIVVIGAGEDGLPIILGNDVAGPALPGSGAGAAAPPRR